MLKKIIISIGILTVIFSANTALAAVSCSVAATCASPGVTVFKMTDTTNAHAELSSESNYSQLVCCTGVTSLSNSCSNSYGVVLRLSDSTNAHVEENSQSTATYDSNDVCLSLPSGTVTIGYEDGSCTGYDTTVVSMSSATTNAHVGDSSAYNRKVCATVSATVTPPSPPPPSPSPSPGGGGMPPAAFNPPTASSGGFGILIEDGAESTNSQTVTLRLNGGPDAKSMALSNSAQFQDSVQEPYQTTKTWTLIDSNDGVKTVYVKFYTEYGQSSPTVSDSITFTKGATVVEKIVEVVDIVTGLLPDFLKPKPIAKPPTIPVEELVSETSPLAFQGQWQLFLLPRQAEFIIAPLPKAIGNLAQKFPTLEKTFEEVGIDKITDVAKLQNVNFILPGVTERVGLPMVKVSSGGLVLPKGVSIANLSPSIKQQIPSEIIFARTGGELIDFDLALSLSDSGEPQQKISTISGKPLRLIVKPDQPVKSVKGYVVFRSKESRTTALELPSQSLLASLIFANPVFAQTQKQPVRVEEKFVLLEFEYFDPDGDGIYEAEINAPVVEGEYEIITVLEFEDEGVGRREIRLITVIDPEGYVYEKDGNRETRIPGAIVSLFWLSPSTKQYELWPAKDYEQENPQTTDVRGTYSFLVPEGFYYLKAETPGYLAYDGKPFQVREGSGVHINIELRTKYWWAKIVDWKTFLLIVVMMLLLYNFYRDKMREKLTEPKIT